MKKLSNKGLTLVELIVSFAIVGVAIIYFFQTLYTVKNVYNVSRDETQAFADKNYVLRILNAYLDEYDELPENFCAYYDLECHNIVNSGLISGTNINFYLVTMLDGTEFNFYKYKEENDISNGTPSDTEDYVEDGILEENNSDDIYFDDDEELFEEDQ